MLRLSPRIAGGPLEAERQASNRPAVPCTPLHAQDQIRSSESCDDSEADLNGRGARRTGWKSRARLMIPNLRGPAKIDDVCTACTTREPRTSGPQIIVVMSESLRKMFNVAVRAAGDAGPGEQTQCTAMHSHFNIPS